ncbi:hypothetical protein OG730_05340 [Streptomyces sp. NBC_01298]|uniref:hypothetical protein n=1 Tax=Streptomyces sp. NBC_01298 TaxID=2903817 RepID=UPI002E0E7E9A|nr:hypothetical protein OG730_05340 [Streptomyces sp. NBC_01298]
MNIPVAVRWALLACAGLNLFFALRALHRMRRAGRGRRTGPGLDALDHALGTVLIATLATGGDHPGVAFGALILLGPVILWKAVRDVRAHREVKTRTATDMS